MIIHDCRFHLQAQVFRDIEDREFGIYISIDDRKRINAYQHKEAQITPSSVTVLTLLEQILLTLDITICGNFRTQMQELIIALCVWVVV